MGRKRTEQSKLELLDKVKSRKMKGLFGAAPPPPPHAALLPEQYYAGIYHQGAATAPVYIAAPAATHAPFACPAVPPLFCYRMCATPFSVDVTSAWGAPSGSLLRCLASPGFPW
ncbi:hypothetical protein HPB52_020328 [Rhipicephalus sanguineus]|uniref:Uncharacterized protein n=1 Tax=Rhipicephalus sanguineus TaxID=34632 RepID=A0A9D4PGD9_RHISA|nr:hypothetical protein HPB52_020328 [Rhipicephalus sanguineus]